MKKILVILAVLIIGSLFVGTVWFLWQKSQEEPVTYETEKPVVTDIVRKTVATGSIIPRREVEIKPRVSGIIDELYVEPGQYVKKGDRIARIKIVPDVVALNNAETQVNRAKISYANAKREFARFQQLFKDSVISSVELNQYQLDMELRAEELDAAENNLQLIREGASKKSGKVSNLVTSTVEGMVLEVPVKEGGSVIESNTFNDGTTIAFVANMSDLIFEGTVDESEVGKIKEGMPLDIHIGALESETFKGTLEYISPKGTEDQGAIQFQVRAAVKPAEGTFIRANYSANADIVLDSRDQVLAINESLLQFKGDTTFVEVETGVQEFEERLLKTGLSDGIFVEVLSGIDSTAKVKKLKGKQLLAQ